MHFKQDESVPALDFLNMIKLNYNQDLVLLQVDLADTSIISFRRYKPIP